jgi:hypothetical protein
VVATKIEVVELGRNPRRQLPPTQHAKRRVVEPRKIETKPGLARQFDVVADGRRRGPRRQAKEGGRSVILQEDGGRAFDEHDDPAQPHRDAARGFRGRERANLNGGRQHAVLRGRCEGEQQR